MKLTSSNANYIESATVKIINFDVENSIKEMGQISNAFKLHKSGLLVLVGISMWCTLLAALVNDLRFLLLSAIILVLVKIIFTIQQNKYRRTMLRLEHQYCLGLATRSLIKVRISPDEKLVKLFLRYQNGLTGTLDYAVTLKPSVKTQSELDVRESVLYISENDLSQTVDVLIKYP